jgi:hemerythrin-like domain-containing protein
VSVRRREIPELPPGTTLRRASALVPLSQDHHHALVQSLRLREAAGAPADPGPAARAFLDHWRTAMAGHFADEEEALFPLAASAFPEGEERLRAEHDELRDLVARLAEALAGSADPRGLMEEIGWLVHDHVRYEERAYFERVQNVLPAEALAEAGRAIEAHRAARGVVAACDAPARPHG